MLSASDHLVWSRRILPRSEAIRFGITRPPIFSSPMGRRCGGRCALLPYLHVPPLALKATMSLGGRVTCQLEPTLGRANVPLEEVARHTDFL